MNIGYRQGDPEHAIPPRKARPWIPMGVDRELLAKRELHDGLILATTKESEDAPEDRDRESRCRPHRAPILLESTIGREAESSTPRHGLERRSGVELASAYGSRWWLRNHLGRSSSP